MKYDLLTELKSNFDKYISLYDNEAIIMQEELHLVPGEQKLILQNALSKAFSKKGVFRGKKQDIIFKYNGNIFVVYVRSDKEFFTFSSLTNDDFLLDAFFYTYSGCYYVSCSNISKKTTISYYESDAIDTFKKYSNMRFSSYNANNLGIIPDKKIELDYCDEDLDNFIKYSLTDDYLRADDYFQELLDIDLSKIKSNDCFLKRILVRDKKD